MGAFVIMLLWPASLVYLRCSILHLYVSCSCTNEAKRHLRIYFMLIICCLATERFVSFWSQFVNPFYSHSQGTYSDLRTLKVFVKYRCGSHYIVFVLYSYLKDCYSPKSQTIIFDIMHKLLLCQIDLTQSIRLWPLLDCAIYPVIWVRHDAVNSVFNCQVRCSDIKTILTEVYWLSFYKLVQWNIYFEKGTNI